MKNLVVICMDTVRYDAFWMPEALAIRDDLTPWNARAVRFRRAQSTSPWTVPAVASVFSGLYPIEHAAGQFQHPIANADVMRPSRLAPTVVTLPKILADHGFSTVSINSNPWLDLTGILQPFSDAERVKPPLVTRSTVDALQRVSRDRRRFFVYAHYMDAHRGAALSPAGGDTTDEERAAITKAMDPHTRDLAIAHAPGRACADVSSSTCVAYLAYTQAVLNIRRHVARILGTLQSANALDDTVVVLYSDHGEEFTDHEPQERQSGNDPRGRYGRGHGHAMYQELLHVPLLAWHPRTRPIDVTTPVSLVDIMPTLLDWLGIASPAVSGVDLAAVNAIDDRRDLAQRPLFSSGIAYGPQKHAALVGNIKAIDISCPSIAMRFDLLRDPKENEPPLEDRRSIVETRKLIRQYRSRRPIAAATSANISAEQVRSLQALGYLKSDGGTVAPREMDCSAALERFESIGEYQPDRGAFLLHYSTQAVSQPDVVVPTNMTGGLPVIGDWDGSGYSEFGVFQARTHSFRLFDGKGTERATVVLTVDGDGSEDIPIAGDWEGDGRSTVGLYRPATSTFFLKNTNSAGPPDLVVTFGIPGDQPIVGDWDGSGITKVGVFRPSNATFFLADNNGTSTIAASTIHFGISGDMPLAGDWDGDGTATIGVFRKSDGRYYLKNGKGGDADVVLRFRDVRGIPISGRWMRKPTVPVD